MPEPAEQLSFDDTRFGFAHRSEDELRRSRMLFRLLNNAPVVKSLSRLTLLALQLRFPVHWLIRQTLFRQFCGGETLEACGPIIAQLREHGLNAALDYAVEDKSTERGFEQVKEETLRSIAFARRHSTVKSISLKLTSLADRRLLFQYSNGMPFNARQEREYAALINRLNAICSEAATGGLHVYIDAEESRILRATDELSRNLMSRFNRQKPVAFITLQMYRRDRLHYLEELFADAKEKGYMPAVKLVRGAYWEKEVNAARREAREPDVFIQKEDTDRAYERALELCVLHLDRVALCAATHNETSALHLTELLRKHKISKDHPHILFSQLYGMSDHISYTLAHYGYPVTKYIPYGPVKQTIPYLIRRAEENTAISGQLSRELRLIVRELERRKDSRSR